MSTLTSTPKSPATSPPAPLEVQTQEFCKEVEISAPLDITWEALLAELAEESQMPDGKPFPAKIERWPGGRWYRDLGENSGHLWGHVQVIKPPALLEICGPMFMSFPAMNHVQYRLTAQNGGTLLKLTHRLFGYMPRDFAKGMEQGWNHKLERVREIARRKSQ